MENFRRENFESQITYKDIVENNIMSSFRLNLSKNRSGDGQSVFPNLLKLQEDGTVDGFFEKAYAEIPDFVQRDSFRKLFNREHMIECFCEGNNQLSLEHKYNIQNDKYNWIITNANICKNSITNDIEALIYTFNIHKPKMIRLILEHMVESDYNYISLVNVHDESYIDIVNEKSSTIFPPNSLKTYSEFVNLLIETEVSPEDREQTLKDKCLDNVIKHLNDNGSYTMIYTALQKNGNAAYKKLRYTYLENDTDFIVFTSTDITREIETEQKKNEFLNSALIAAKQANSAKTDFLSRMSHEIRTPMNAIIGMTAIAAQSIGDNEQIGDCISKIGISSRFLLSLINDILDMSRIESGKILLKNEKIQFDELIGAINSICFSQAKAKDIDYECMVDHSVEDTYLGDAMKLQQVLVNILSNAIKFTKSKGKVSIDIKQLKRNEEHAVLRFSINDTGCGIDETFIPYLFEPFSQEHSGTTSMHGGTGLGLAICKNLVDLMDGKIEVRSIVGVGTEFIVTIKLGITEETRENYIKKISYNFTQLNTLVVDDDVIVCQHAILTLKEIGITAEWVDSGKKSIAKVKEKLSAGQYYDLILLDWKMPEMDGIETAKEIRNIVGPDVTIIIMTAYDWISIEHEAKLAGVNLLISKPIFKSSLVSAFYKVFNEKNEETAKKEQNDFDFSGKKVLLVEDHPLNVEVAKRLLENKGFVVEHAENGLRAIEMFTLANDNYYSAILMDVRMPVMDGLQAAHGIRHLHKTTAKTIPIIAMTANAFDDDMEKSKKAGMNAHLAKPIDPIRLYSTLHRYIFEESEAIK